MERDAIVRAIPSSVQVGLVDWAEKASTVANDATPSVCRTLESPSRALH